MIDLHTHTLHSDGDLAPSELIRRAEYAGYRYLGLADHVDSSNIDTVIPALVKTAREVNPHVKVRVIPGAELTHVPPALIGSLTRRAHELGAAYVVVHGESPVEPVAPGTNRAAIDAGVDILAHPGLLTREDAEAAAQNNVLLEITTRHGHSLTNGHVGRLANAVGARLVLNTDTHTIGDMVTVAFARMVVLGAGLNEEAFETMRANAMELIERIGYI